MPKTTHSTRSMRVPTGSCSARSAARTRSAISSKASTLQQLVGDSSAQLTINETGGDSIVHFNGINRVRVEDVTGLTAADFLFS